MQYRTLGRTDLEISRLILGCGNFGGIGSDPRFFGMGESDGEAFALMGRAYDAGVTVFDTADAYGGGRSEETIGRWLRDAGSAVRSNLLLSSKVGNPMGTDGDPGGLAAARIKQQIDASLKRLRTDYLDMYLLHQPDPATPIEETLGALNDLVTHGKVRYYGASNIDAPGLRDALSTSADGELARFEWVQNGYSLLERDQESDVIPVCEEMALGFTPFSPLAGGWLTGKYDAIGDYEAGSRMTLRPEPYHHLENERTLAGLRRLQAAANARGTSMAALAMAWVLARPMVTGIVIGPRDPKHLDDALAAVPIELDSTESNELAGFFPVSVSADG